MLGTAKARGISANAIRVECHVGVPGEMAVEAAHVICDTIERGVQQAVDGARSVIHVAPEHKAKLHRVGGVIRL